MEGGRIFKGCRRYPFRAVQKVLELGVWEPGETLGKKAKDEEIVPWCNKNGHVIVTCDDDFRSREMREGLLNQTSVEVIWFQRQPKGTRQQFEQITKHYPVWDELLGKIKPAYRQWLQPPYGRLKKMSR